MRRTALIALLLAAFVVAGCSPSASRPPEPAPPAPAEASPADPAALLEPASVGQVPRLSRAGHILLAGQPTADDFPALREAGVTTVINLRHAIEMDGFDEAAAVEASGMAYEALPWNGPAELNDALFDRTRELLREADGNVLLHCASANRVGAVWLPFRVLDQGVDLEQAVEEAKQAGMRTPEYETMARDYIARHR